MGSAKVVDSCRLCELVYIKANIQKNTQNRFFYQQKKNFFINEKRDLFETLKNK